MRILYVTTIGNTMGFFKSFIKKIITEGDIVDIATNTDGMRTSDYDFYKKLGCEFYRISTSRSPLSTSNLKAIREIKNLVERNHYDIVHCHTPIAAACTRLACKGVRKKGTRVFYTAHGFHFYTGAPLKNWMVYYPVEKWLSRYTDILITINKEDYERAKKKFRAGKIEYVPGVGIDLNKFNSEYKSSQELEKKRRELGLEKTDKMLLSVGELSIRKNHRVVIEALSSLADSSIHYFIAGTGEKKDELENFAKEKGVNLTLLGFRTDISELIQASDLFVFPSLQEGLPVALMEAIACKVPVVCSEIRGNTDLVSNPDYLFEASDSHTLAERIKNVIEKDSREVVEQNHRTLLSFDLLTVENEVRKIYEGGYCSG